MHVMCNIYYKEHTKYNENNSKIQKNDNRKQNYGTYISYQKNQDVNETVTDND